jgi:thiol-disulfide isomerase/thioredoxin
MNSPRVGHPVEWVLILLVESIIRSDQYRLRAMLQTRPATILKCLPLAFALLSTPLLAKHVPDPAFKTLDGQARKLSSLHGQIVVVNFWATWCGPCQEELPRLRQIAASYAGKPVSFVYISIDEAKNRSKIPSTLSRLHVDFDSWVGADTDTLGRFGLGDIVPGTLILDENGEPVARIMGEAREDDVRIPVDWLLGSKTGPPPAALTKRY